MLNMLILSQEAVDTFLNQQQIQHHKNLQDQIHQTPQTQPHRLIFLIQNT